MLLLDATNETNTLGGKEIESTRFTSFPRVGNQGGIENAWLVRKRSRVIHQKKEEKK